MSSLSLFDLYKVGIGPSSSHTVGPMVAANRFLLNLESRGLLDAVEGVEAHLYGSLALTGKGHATDRAVILGLHGETPDKVDPDLIDGLLDHIETSGCLDLGARKTVPFVAETHLIFHFMESLPQHPNGMRFVAQRADGSTLLEEVYYSVGGGFVLSEEQFQRTDDEFGSNVKLTYPFETAEELLARGRDTGLSIAQMVLRNERAWRSDEETEEGIHKIWEAMNACIERGCHTEGVLPGGLTVPRRAPELYRTLTTSPEAALRDPLTVLDYVSLYALAVNEENAAGARVVTAPTNGAAGIIPAVVAYYDRFVPNATRQGICTLLATAGAIGMLYKKNASISAAEVGCQGEVGVACSMAAGGLTAALGGTNAQTENAAEIGMEHNLGLTCDPIGGLVQIPCIERNTMGAIKAINASRLALRGDGSHKVPLDKVIETMRQTGFDMQAKYKETSQGGLAVNVVAC